MKRFLLVLFLPLFTLCANADDPVEIEGIYYYLESNPNVAKVTYTNSYSGYYSGDIIIPETVTYEGVKYSVTSIGDTAFENCYDLTSVTIPNGVTSIGIAAFLGCTDLTSVTIPNTVTTIGWSAFQDCKSLTSVNIPDGLTSINSSVFGSTGLTSVTVPNSVTSIGDFAFSGCPLTSIIIGSGVTSIFEYSFIHCQKLTDVYCMAENVPHTSPDTFDWSSIGQATLHVPEQSIDAYKAASPWNKFGTIVSDATGITRIHNDPVQVHHDNGHITVEGVEEGTAVSVYDIKGVQIGSAIVEGGKVSIPTNLQTGNIAIVKIKDKSIKVTIK